MNDSGLPTTPEDSDGDTFGYVVDVAAAAKQAVDQAALASNKAAYVSTLAEKARRQAADLEQLAESLLSTAASVSKIAVSKLDLDDVRETFQNNPSYCQQIDFDTFYRVISGNEWVRRSDVTSCCVTPLEDNSRPKRESSKSPEVDPKTEPALKGRRHSLPIHMSSVGPGSSSGSTPKSRGMYELEGNAKEKYLKERFPSPRLLCEYKDNLAARFDSSNSILPLWEDRYVHEPAQTSTQQTGGLVSKPETWTEKKALKQFQIKLQQLEPTAQDGETVDSSPVRGKTSEDVVCVTAAGRQTSSSFKKVLNLETDSDQSTDSEVEGILRDPKPLRKLKKQEESIVKCRYPDHQEMSRLTLSAKKEARTVSPLLNDTERGLYSVSGEESTSPIPRGKKHKHIFQRSASIEREKGRDSS